MMFAGAAFDEAAGDADDRPVLWRPDESAIERARITDFARWLGEEHGLVTEGYADLWRYSVTDLNGFWKAIWSYFGVRGSGGKVAIAEERVEGAEWFPGSTLNYAEHVFADRDDADLAIVHASELRPRRTMTIGELRRQVTSVAAGLRACGVGRGDRVVGYLPNIVEAVVAFLATASLGAIWSSCSPDFGTGSVIDRFAQIEPKFMFAVDGYRYGGKDHDRRGTVAEIQAALPTLASTVLVGYLQPASPGLALAKNTTDWDAFVDRQAAAELEFERVPFDHPLWILYSSGTTGVPKAIVQGHGGILLEHLKQLHLHFDVGPEDRLFWYTTTGWMMWNFVVSGLLTSAGIVLYDGSPGHPDLGVLWDLADQADVTIFGTSAGYLSSCMRAGIEPRSGRDLARLRGIGSTGSTLSPEGFEWVYEQFDDIWLFSNSGGTDLCSAFVGGVPTLPVVRGELQARMLGSAVEAWDEEGVAVTGAVGELVITKPMPSMPLFFWGDDDFSRYHESYFSTYPGVWRHGDWIEITDRGSAVIYGRSDSTINRGGVRMGTAEIYRSVLALKEVVDALVVDLPRPGTEGWMPLFVVLRDGVVLDDEVKAKIAGYIRQRCSPRHVPDEVLQVKEIPRTLSGKPLEVPVKKILMGFPLETSVNRDSMANPDSLDYFIEMASK